MMSCSLYRCEFAWHYLFSLHHLNVYTHDELNDIDKSNNSYFKQVDFRINNIVSVEYNYLVIDDGRM